ncbi:MAG: DegT/DnrJ/EryC1/StrS family aminotransferase [Candidatus Calescibacterium sp.]|nr:DegT/DnrJ/EryC1/StrS family aminotransferase [Candidatus Calescibacterium sp.]MCX7972748.1 DegT/DnrJ/EryC1/StrS family aminotransferase [bacterium]MDW8195207.1 DegT/DnrJ/EryC1/StrS family aminotransferase [Candidatus Calescibacterium sp.]
MKGVEFFSLKNEINLLKDEILQEVNKVLESGKFIMSSNVQEFENQICKYFGVKYAVSVNSGTDALVISLRAAGIKPGDEVITTPFTFFATAEAISIIGAIPVFVDIDEATFNIDANRIEEKITSKTKAILPVHLFGLPCDMEKIMDIARRYDLVVIEDNAQGFGSEVKINGRFVKTGTIGHAGAFSFFPTKNLGAYGDGGIIITNDDNIFEKASMLKNHGSRIKYYNEMLGYNSRLDEIQAAILKVKLKYVEKFNESRITIAHRYTQALQGLNEYIAVPYYDSTKYKHVFHQYSIKVKNGLRDNFREFLNKNGINTFVYYPYPIHKLPVYRDMGYSLPVSERIAQEIVSLPMYHLMEIEKVDYIVSKIKEWVHSLSFR